VPPPTAAELEALLGRIVGRIARHLERRGLVVRDAENSYLDAAPDAADGLATLVGHSITYRIAVGPNEGRKAFTLQPLRPAHRPVPLPRAARGGPGGRLATPRRGDLRTQRAVRGQHAVVPRQVHPGFGYQGREPRHDKSAGLPICTPEGRPAGVRHRDERLPRYSEGLEALDRCCSG
jgi:hypothetical protein